MIARDALLEQIDELSKRSDVAAGRRGISAYAGAERHLVARCDGTRRK